MPPDESLVELQKSKVEDLEDLIRGDGELKKPGFFDVLPSLSEIVKHCYANGSPITTIEELEEQALKQYKESGKPDFEYLHVALVLRQGENLNQGQNLNDSSHSGVILDWSFNKNDVNLIVWEGSYRCQDLKVADAISMLFPGIRYIRYACTKCFEQFDEKKEWMRHENTQHFQLQAWRCSQPSTIPPSTISPSMAHLTTECSQLFYEKKGFKEHLSTLHECEETEAVAAASVIGRNGQRQTWCGFCRTLVLLHKEGQEAWEERFDHIEKYYQSGQVIDNWLLPRGHKTATVVTFLPGKVRVVQAICNPSEKFPVLTFTLRGLYDLDMSCYNKDTARGIIKWILCPADPHPVETKTLPLREDKVMRETDSDAYDISNYMPDVDHGSVLITTRLASLQQLGETLHLKSVNMSQAYAIFREWYNQDFGKAVL
ncbi:hypothetical protein ACJ73_01601 [Blastomyces percursus]|uniref:C2H2-type domain-containing protein n=1 Tax=Blastomyces percursus TaxID=1658174 RepID=A0A1J9RG86_9EURO|nr:hypothetical protein ACJ73_01601 [Blastomyces percursus]